MESLSIGPPTGCEEEPEIEGGAFVASWKPPNLSSSKALSRLTPQSCHDPGRLCESSLPVQ